MNRHVVFSDGNAAGKKKNDPSKGYNRFYLE